MQVLTIVPSQLLPYLVGWTDEVEKALFLRRFGVLFWGLTDVFGHNDDDWHRLNLSFGRDEIVSTTLKDPNQLPVHLLADEKHVHFNGAKGDIATTVGQDTILGASLALGAVRKISKHLGYPNDVVLNTWVKKRRLHSNRL